ncbi:MAG: hypothetical protein NTY19_05085 [Planctomycetota bacterium]|nr:hypothetical protein [Planctomycetota bacterium]
MDSYPSPIFPPTSWSMVRDAQHKSGENRLEAMNRCMAAYWRPVFYFIRSKGYPLHRAEDLTQEFFLHFFLGEDGKPDEKQDPSKEDGGQEQDAPKRKPAGFQKADQQKGRFRNFLLTVLVRFLADQSPKRARKQAAFDQGQVAISALVGDSERTFEPPHNRTPEQVFMQKWAWSVIEAVRRNLKNWCDSRGRPDWYSMFCARLFPEPGSPRITQQALAERLHVTRDQVRQGLERTEAQFAEFLRAEVTNQIGPDDDLDTEIRELQVLLSGGPVG